MGRNDFKQIFYLFYRYKLLFVLSFTMIVFSSCFTLNHKIDYKASNNPIHEFNYHNIKYDNVIKIKDHYKIIEGLYTGKVDTNNNFYFQFQFRNVLKGNERILNLFVGINDTVYPFVTETNNIGKGKKVFLFLVDTLIENYIEFRKDTIKKHIFYDIELEKNNYDRIFKEFSISNNKYMDSIFFIKWKIPQTKYGYNSDLAISIISKNKNGKYVINRQKDKSVDFNNSININAIARTKKRKIWNKILFPVAAIADIVTSPIQIIGVVAFGGLMLSVGLVMLLSSKL